MRRCGWDRFGWLLLFVPVLAVLLEPKVINAVIGFGLRKLKREPLERPLTRQRDAHRARLGAARLGLLRRCTCTSIALEAGLLFAIGAFALSWCLGIMTFVVPAGAGVREVAMVAVLAPVMDARPGHRRGALLQDRDRSWRSDLRRDWRESVGTSPTRCDLDARFRGTAGHKLT